MTNPWSTPNPSWHWRYYFPLPVRENRKIYLPFKAARSDEGPRQVSDFYSWELLSPHKNPNDKRKRREPLTISKGRKFRKLSLAETNARAVRLAEHESPRNERYGPSSPMYAPEPEDERLGLWLTHDVDDAPLSAGKQDQAGEEAFLKSERDRELAMQKTEHERWEREQVAHLPELRWVRRNDLMFYNDRVPCMEGIRARGDKPSTYGFQLQGQYELNEWDGYSNEGWVEHCPHFLANPEHPGSYQHEIRPCAWGNRCLNFPNDTNDPWEWRDPRSPCEERRMCLMDNVKCTITKGRRGPLVLTSAGDDDSEGRKYYVCRHHLEASRRYFQPQTILEAMRFGTCTRCRSAYLKQHPNGLNTCTCEETMNQWLCRFDFRDALVNLIERFIWRISRTGPWGGVPGPDSDAYFNERFTAPAHNPYFGYKRYATRMEDWYYDFLTTFPKEFREAVYHRHPCGLGCGRVRQVQGEVMDCRSCGGMVIRPKNKPDDPIEEDSNLILRKKGGKARKVERSKKKPRAVPTATQQQSGLQPQGEPTAPTTPQPWSFPTPPLRTPESYVPKRSPIPEDVWRRLRESQSDEEFDTDAIYESLESPGDVPTINTWDPARFNHAVVSPEYLLPRIRSTESAKDNGGDTDDHDIGNDGISFQDNNDPSEGNALAEPSFTIYEDPSETPTDPATSPAPPVGGNIENEEHQSNPAPVPETTSHSYNSASTEEDSDIEESHRNSGGLLASAETFIRLFLARNPLRRGGATATTTNDDVVFEDEETDDDRRGRGVRSGIGGGASGTSGTSYGQSNRQGGSSQGGGYYNVLAQGNPLRQLAVPRRILSNLQIPAGDPPLSPGVSRLLEAARNSAQSPQDIQDDLWPSREGRRVRFCSDWRDHAADKDDLGPNELRHDCERDNFCARPGTEPKPATTGKGTDAQPPKSILKRPRKDDDDDWEGKELAKKTRFASPWNVSFGKKKWFG